MEALNFIKTDDISSDELVEWRPEESNLGFIWFPSSYTLLLSSVKLLHKTILFSTKDPKKQ